MKGSKKKVLWGGFVISRCHFASSKFTNTSQTNSEALSNLHDVGVQ